MDTSGFYSVAIPRDINFAVAQRIRARVTRDRAVLVTTTYGVAEAHALFLHRASRDAGVAFLQSFETSAVELIVPTPEDESAAREIVYRYTDKEFSLTDAISFAVMQRLGILTAFTFDRDFERYGFASARA